MSQLDAIFCSSSQSATGRFLEAALLSLLKEETSYGYGLMEKLQIFGFDKDSLNSSLIYRNLRKMEKSGLINSTWQESSQGPKKRTYEISKLGLEALDQWMILLEDRRKMLDAIIKFNQE